MPVLITLGVLPLLFLLLCSRTTERASDNLDWREAFLSSAVWWGAILTAITIGLSLASALNRVFLALCWGVVLAGLAIIGWRSGRLRRGWKVARAQFRAVDIPRVERAVLATILAYSVLLFVIAWVAPPNTNDSLRYHMSRVMHWQQNQTLAHYNTPIAVQLWMPPWSEMAILNLVILTHGDRLANLVQWLAMAGSLIGISYIAKQLGAGIPGQVFAAVFGLTLPIGILQATSTQTDYTAAFWTICLAAFTLQQLKGQADLLTTCNAGLSVALGLLTKGTFLAFAAPFLAAWLLALAARKAWQRLAVTALVFLVATLLLNAYFWLQNMQTFGYPLGPAEDVRGHINEAFTPGTVFSNLLRNTTIHLGTPYGIINGNLQAGVEALLRRLGQDANDPATTMDHYAVRRYLTEDRAGNPWHLLAIPALAAIGWVTRRWARRAGREVLKNKAATRPDSRSRIQYALLLLVSFTLFSALYKWQSTGSRMQLPWFALLAAWAGVLWEGVSDMRLRSVFYAFFLLIGLPFIVSNPSRPFLPFRDDPQTIWNTSRQVMLFRNSPEEMRGYLSLTSRLEATGCHQVGLRIDSSDAEYPFWALLADAGYAVRFEHLFPTPPIATSRLETFVPCAIICTFCTTDRLNGLPADSTHYGGFTLYLAPEYRP